MVARSPGADAHVEGLLEFDLVASILIQDGFKAGNLVGGTLSRAMITEGAR